MESLKFFDKYNKIGLWKKQVVYLHEMYYFQVVMRRGWMIFISDHFTHLMNFQYQTSQKKVEQFQRKCQITCSQVGALYTQPTTYIQKNRREILFLNTTDRFTRVDYDFYLCGGFDIYLVKNDPPKIEFLVFFQ